MLFLINQVLVSHISFQHAYFINSYLIADAKTFVKNIRPIMLYIECKVYPNTKALITKFSDAIILISIIEV